MNERITRSITRHLEYVGYEVREQEDGWHLAVHPVRYNFQFRALAFGVRLHALISMGTHVASRGPWLRFVNRANEASLLTQFTFGRDNEGTYFVRMRALLPPTYRRQPFGVLLDLCHEDLALCRSAPVEAAPVLDEQEDEERPSVVVN